MLRAEQRLMLAVLEEGIETLLKHARASRGHAARLRREAMSWLVTQSAADQFAFERLCEALDIDAAKLRRRVLAEVRRRQPA